MTASVVSIAQTPMLDAALAYAKQGWHVHPLHWVRDKACSCGRDCQHPGKHPLTTHGFKDGTTDPLKIHEWWTKWPQANIGVATGASRLVVVDVDPRNNGDEELEGLLAKHGALPDTRLSLTGGGGFHYVFNVPFGLVPPRSWVAAQGVEIKADGGYIVAPPSTHVLGQYLWDSGRPKDLADAPEWLQAAPKKRDIRGGSNPQEGILGAAFVAAGMAGRAIGGNKMTVVCPWASEHTTGAPHDSSTVVFGPGPGQRWGWFDCRHSHCQLRLSKLSKEQKWRELAAALPPEAVDAAKASVRGAEREVSHVMRAPWEESLRWNTSGTALRNDTGNLAILLENLQEWQTVFKYDEARDKLYWADTPPPVMGLRSPEKDAAIGDYDYIYISQWFALQPRFQVAFKKDQIQDAVLARGWSNRHNSLLAHLDGLQWDGVYRAERWLHEYLGVEDTPYSRFVGRAWLISAMARAYRPGCKADHVLVLEGRQGVGKTSTFEIIGGEWHLPDVPRVDNKDARGILNTAWIAEFSELAALKGVEQQKVKSFITERVDKYRPPYGRNFLTKPRRCVFAGSTNECEWIQDSTGGRRFWPVRVTRVAFLELQRDRDALLAEARDLYRSGEIWHPGYEGEIEHLIREQQAVRIETDPWERLIAQWIEKRKAIDSDYHPTIADGLVACGVQIDRWTQSDSRRVGKCLRSLGWTKKRVRIGDSFENLWLHGER